MVERKCHGENLAYCPGLTALGLPLNEALTRMNFVS
jgi:hypothetical protein